MEILKLTASQYSIMKKRLDSLEERLAKIEANL